MRNRIIFLCTGNICRSPIAEVVAQQAFSGLGLSFSSAGLEAVRGLPASDLSVAYGIGCGCSLVGHRSQPVSSALLADCAWVIGMTRSHAAIFRSRHAETFTGAIGVLGAPGVDLAVQRHSPEAEEVDDPYGRTEAEYDFCGDQITRLLKGWAATFLAMSVASGVSGIENLDQETKE